MRRSIRDCAAIAAIGAVAAGWAGLAQAQRSDVEIWSQSCGNCHTNQPARRYSADQWGKITTHMMVQARLTDDESAAILRFLRKGSRQPAAPTSKYQESAANSGTDDEGVLLASTTTITVAEWLQDPNGASLYSKECKSCHGKRGKGDGRAAKDLDPKPTDITDSEFLSETTDSAMEVAIRDGSEGMDPTELNGAEVDAVIQYVRKLGGIRAGSN
jgi:cytochrome c5